MSFNPEEFFSRKQEETATNPFTQTKSVEEKMASVKEQALDDKSNNEIVVNDLLSKAISQSQGGSQLQQVSSEGNGEVGGVSSTSQVSLQGAGIQPVGQMSIVGESHDIRAEEQNALNKIKQLSQSQNTSAPTFTLGSVSTEPTGQEFSLHPQTDTSSDDSLSDILSKISEEEDINPMSNIQVQETPQQEVQEIPQQQVPQQELPQQQVQNGVTSLPASDGSRRARIRHQAEQDALIESGQAVDVMGNKIDPYIVNNTDEDYETDEGVPSQVVEGGEVTVDETALLLQELNETPVVEQPQQQVPQQQVPQQQVPQQQVPQQQVQQQVPQQEQVQQQVPQQQVQQQQVQQQVQQPVQPPYQGAHLLSPQKIFVESPLKFSSSSINLANFAEGQTVIGEAYIKDIKYSKWSRGVKTDAKFVLANGELITGIRWGTFNEYDETSIKTLNGMVVQLSGKWSMHNGSQQITFDSIAPANATTADYYVQGVGDLSVHDAIFNELYESIQDNTLKYLIWEVFFNRNFIESYKTTPAASSQHDSGPDGLYRHTVKVAHNAFNATRLYPKVNADIVIVSALLHDIGKIYEMPNGEYSEDGVLFGHIYMGARLVEDVMNALHAQGIEINPNHRKNIIHCILSHHSQLDWGAVVVPATPEAEVLATADLMDARVTRVEENLGENRKGQIPYPRQTIFNLNK